MTYSIVARDPQTGELAVAVQSHFFGVGRVCPFVRAGVGAVATQASVDPAYGPKGLDLMASGTSPADALATLVAADEGSTVRQVAMIDGSGAVAAHTGSNCIADASHLTGENFSVQANMMTSPGVPEAMAEAFTSTAGELIERILTALDAAEGAGGDIRGRQSAALLASPGERGAVFGADRTWDLRVDDHPEPLVELRRLAKIKVAYEAPFLRGDPSRAEVDAALQEVDQITGNNPEMAFWAALSLADKGEIDHARDLVNLCSERDPRWVDLLRRLPATGRLSEELAATLIDGNRST